MEEYTSEGGKALCFRDMSSESDQGFLSEAGRMSSKSGVTNDDVYSSYLTLQVESQARHTSISGSRTIECSDTND